jgi:hypothetical protein
MVAPIVAMPNAEKHSGVSGIPTQLLVLHSGESPLRGGYAQSLTSWANIPLNAGGPEASWHWFVDPIAIVSMVDPNNAAWHASEANPMSEGFEQAGYARLSRAEWLTPEGVKQMDNLAWLMAQRAKANGIPPVWLTTAQVEAVTKHGNRTIKGFCLHRQIDPETRTDPGDGYPYDLLMAKVKAYINPIPTTEELVMSWTTKIQEYQKDGKTKAGIKTAGFILGNLNQWVGRILEGQVQIRKDIAALRKDVTGKEVQIDWARVEEAARLGTAGALEGSVVVTGDVTITEKAGQ